MTNQHHAISTSPATGWIRRGKMKGLWGITISANWRIVFRFQDGDIYEIDLIDYH